MEVVSILMSPRKWVAKLGFELNALALVLDLNFTLCFLSDLYIFTGCSLERFAAFG